MGFALTNEAIDKYFGFLAKLDNKSKKRLIIKLTESIDTKEENISDLKDIYGAWEDTRDSDQIIKEIMNSKIRI